MPEPPVYLDHPASTPCDPRVVEAMAPYWTEFPGNPSSSHTPGMRAAAAVEHARAQVADLIGAQPREIIFTSGATESTNLAILGGCKARHAAARHLIVGATEHHAVLDPAEHLEHEGWQVTRLPAKPDGTVDPGALTPCLRADTALVSLMWANNETGAITDIAACASACRALGVPLHSDATAAVGHVPIDVRTAGIDFLSFSGHKLYGPKGVGALWVRSGRPRVALEARQFGGSQERSYRAGTLPTPLIVGFGFAARLAAQALAQGEAARLEALSTRLWQGLSDLPHIERTGPAEPEKRVPGLLHVTWADLSSADLLIELRPFVSASVGSACTTGSREPSHVLLAMGMDHTRARGALRLGLGRSTTETDIDRAIAAIRRAVHVAQTHAILTSAH